MTATSDRREAGAWRRAPSKRGSRRRSHARRPRRSTAPAGWRRRGRRKVPARRRVFAPGCALDGARGGNLLPGHLASERRVEHARVDGPNAEGDPGTGLVRQAGLLARGRRGLRRLAGRAVIHAAEVRVLLVLDHGAASLAQRRRRRWRCCRFRRSGRRCVVAQPGAVLRVRDVLHPLRIEGRHSERPVQDKTFLGKKS